MSMGEPAPLSNEELADQLEEPIEEITVDITEDGMVWVHGTDVDLLLAPTEARELGQALQDAADDAEAPLE